MTATTVANPAAVSDGVNVLDESRINFDEAAELLPGRKGKPTRQAVRRWAVAGTLVKNEATGEVRRVRLEARRVAGTWFTSREACQRYIAACNPTHEQQERTPAGSSRAAAAAGKRLAAKGL